MARSSAFTRSAAARHPPATPFPCRSILTRRGCCREALAARAPGAAGGRRVRGHSLSQHRGDELPHAVNDGHPCPGFTIANYARALTDSLYLGLLADTLLYALATKSISLVLAFPLARTESRWRGLLNAGVLSPLLTGVVIRCFGWIILLANDGLVNQGLGLFGLGPYRFINGVGVTIALVHVFLPFMILPIMNA